MFDLGRSGEAESLRVDTGAGEQIPQGVRPSDWLVRESVLFELRRVAAGAIARLGAAGLLEPTAVIHEAYLRLANNPTIELPTRERFFGLAARLVRCVIIDEWRRENARSPGRQAQRVTLSGDFADRLGPRTELMDLSHALEDLDRRDPFAAAIIELHFLGGLSQNETARALKEPVDSVRRHLRYALAYLRERLQRNADLPTQQRGEPEAC
jgi:RNA polymerase sigma factor (TIGR02999 family)